jgi:SAM-dependent methyltransferase
MTQKRLTWEQAVGWLNDQPDLAELCRAAYLDPPVAGAAKRYRESAEWAAVRELLPKNRTSGTKRALDLGAGNGIMSYALAADGWDVTAVEPDPSKAVGAGAIRALAAETGVAIKVVEAFGEAIPLEAANFDVVVARQVLHHAADLKAFCCEMARLVRPGGTVITLRDHVIDGPASKEAFFKIHPLHHLYGGENAFQTGEYRAALVDAGLTISKQFGSFDSVINYAPFKIDDLRAAAVERFPLALRSAAKCAVALVPTKMLCAAATRADRRPGRLVSFLARKPEKSS